MLSSISEAAAMAMHLGISALAPSLRSGQSLGAPSAPHGTECPLHCRDGSHLIFEHDGGGCPTVVETVLAGPAILVHIDTRSSRCTNRHITVRAMMHPQRRRYRAFEGFGPTCLLYRWATPPLSRAQRLTVRHAGNLISGSLALLCMNFGLMLQ